MARPRGLRGVAWVVLVATAAAVAALTTSPEPARAQTSPPSIIDKIVGGTASSAERNAWNTILQNTITGPPSGASTADKGRLASALYRSRLAARLLPASGSGVLLRVGLVAAGAYIGWRVYQHYTGGSTATLDMWLDSGALGGDSLYNPCANTQGVSCPDAAHTLTWSPYAYVHSITGSGSDDHDKYPGFLTNNKQVGAAWVYSTIGSVYNQSCVASGTVTVPCYVLHVNPAGYAPVARADAPGGDYCDPGGEYITGQLSSCWIDWDEGIAAYGSIGWVGGDSEAGWNSNYPKALAEAVGMTLNHAVANHSWIHKVQVGGAYTVSGHTVKRYKYEATPAEIAQHLNVAVPGGSFTPDETDDYTVPSDQGTTTDTTNAATQAASDDCAKAWFDSLLSSAFYWISCTSYGPVPGDDTGGEPIAVPQPDYNETFPEYRARLRTAGFLGTITWRVWTDDAAEPMLDPDSVTRVKLGAAGSAEPYYDTLTWPGTAPMLVPNHAITVWSNPGPDSGSGTDDGSGTDTDTTGTPPPPGDATGADCNCPPIDFTPITDADVGDKFPFAIIGWVSGWVGALVSTPTAPEFDFTNPAWGSTHYDVNLNVMDTYAATIRTLIAWAMWIGAIWWFGSRLLGFTATGDPGEAVDEAW